MGVKLVAEPQAEEIAGKTMATLFLLHPCGGTGTNKGGEMNHRRRRTSDRLFECKTCNRRFPTFQALGGHRTSHKRPRVGGERLELVQSKKMKPKVHGCPICGLEFPMGQALGGHMRRHKPAVATSSDRSEKKDGAGAAVMLDLNSPPLDGGMEFTNLGLGVGFLKDFTLFDFLGCSASAS